MWILGKEILSSMVIQLEMQSFNGSGEPLDHLIKQRKPNYFNSSLELVKFLWKVSLIFKECKVLRNSTFIKLMEMIDYLLLILGEFRVQSSRSTHYRFATNFELCSLRPRLLSQFQSIGSTSIRFL